MVEFVFYKDLNKEEKNNLWHDLGSVICRDYGYSINTLAYEQCYIQNKLNDLSLVFRIHKKWSAVVFINPIRDDVLTSYGKPIEIHFDQTVTEGEKFEVYHKFLEVLKQKFAMYGKCLFKGNSFYFRYFDGSPELKIITFESAYTNLELELSQIKRMIRKSFRSLINWGGKNLDTHIVNKQNWNEDLFEDFRLFHIRVSGRETRSKESWDFQQKMILEGEGFLVLGFLEKKMVSGALILTGTETCFYAVGVNDRELMAQKVAVGHFTIYRSIEIAKSLGLKRFIFGKVGPSFDSEKETAIGQFKKGFSTDIEFLMSIETDNL